MRVAWATDPHLNHVPVNAWDRWIDRIRACCADAVVITGDISEGDDVMFQLHRIAETLAVDIYFVLGNHDFYQSSIARTRRQVIDVCRQHPKLHYLTDMMPVELQPGVFLVGEDGWGDATQGDFERSPVRLNDFNLIEDFQRVRPTSWKRLLQKQGRFSAERLGKKLEALPTDAKDVLIATHVPPFRQACWYQGHTTDDNWAPFFVCGQLGERLLQQASGHHAMRLSVMCGHTHHDGVATMRENLTVYTAAAEYGEPQVEAVWQIEPDAVTFMRVAACS